jgi:hypothetical protein
LLVCVNWQVFVSSCCVAGSSWAAVVQSKSGGGVFPLSGSPAPVASPWIRVPGTPLPSSSVAEQVIVWGRPGGFVAVSGVQSSREAVHLFVTTSVSSGSSAAPASFGPPAGSSGASPASAPSSASRSGVAASLSSSIQTV